MNAQTAPELTHVVPLHLLVQSKTNVRKTNVKEGIEALAASIQSVGLRQNLNVRRLEDGKSEVISGQRRLLALQLLAKQKKIPEDFLVPCLEVKDESQAKEISIAENVMREQMHPADQFEAFNALVVDGMPIEDVAARFGVTPTVVKQRMKLSTVSPKLLKVYRAGSMTLEQLMEFTICDDYKRQNEVWEEFKDSSWYEAGDIKAALMEGFAETISERICRFVGLKAYEAAGGEVVRDLFDEQNAGYMKDNALVEKLAKEKLEAKAAEVKKEGWLWVEAAPNLNQEQRLGRVYLDGKKFKPEDVARAGVRITINWQGELSIDRGLVRAQDMPKEERKAAGIADKPEYSLPQMQELSIQRTAALRFSLMQEPLLALTALAHCLALDALYFTSTGSSLQIHLSSADTTNERQVPNPEECSAQALLSAAEKKWQERLPKDPEKLWAWLLGQTKDVIEELLVYCASISLNAIHTKYGTSGAPTDASHADLVAKELSFNFADHWQPQAPQGFAGRMSKAQLAKALAEAGCTEANIKHMQGFNKRDACIYAEGKLKAAKWVPSFLSAANDNKPKKERAA